MKKMYFSLLLGCFSILVAAQKKDTININQGLPFAIIEKAPTYPGCETLRENLHKMCLQNQVSKYISQNFNLSITDSLNLSPGKQRVYVQFTISKDGTIEQVKARAQHKRLEEEGIRVVSSLPKMIPGKHKGQSVNVKYTLPITFLVEGKHKKTK